MSSLYHFREAYEAMKLNIAQFLYFFYPTLNLNLYSHMFQQAMVKVIMIFESA